MAKDEKHKSRSNFRGKSRQVSKYAIFGVERNPRVSFPAVQMTASNHATVDDIARYRSSRQNPEPQEGNEA